MIATLGSFWAIGHYVKPLFNEWAGAHKEKQHNLLVAARQAHIDSVQERIDGVKKLGGVIDVTKGLFEVSKVCVKNRSSQGMR